MQEIDDSLEDERISLGSNGQTIVHSEERRSMVYNKNGSRMNDTIAINVHAWKIAAGFVSALVTIVVTTWTTVVWIAAPHFREAIAEQMKPLALAIELEETRMNAHILEEATNSGIYYNKTDIANMFDRINKDIERIDQEIMQIRSERR